MPDGIMYIEADEFALLKAGVAFDDILLCCKFRLAMRSESSLRAACLIASLAFILLPAKAHSSILLNKT